MKQNWVFDASPLIVLGKAKLLKIISPLAICWFIPQSVEQEISHKSSIEPLLLQLSEKAKVERKVIDIIDPLISNWNLGYGESEAITLAMHNPGYGVVLDDLQARKCAKIMNIPLIGSLGLLVKAKKEGMLEIARPAFESLISLGLYVDKALIDKILSSIGE